MKKRKKNCGNSNGIKREIYHHFSKEKEKEMEKIGEQGENI